MNFVLPSGLGKPRCRIAGISANYLRIAPCPNCAVDDGLFGNAGLDGSGIPCFSGLAPLLRAAPVGVGAPEFSEAFWPDLHTRREGFTPLFLLIWFWFWLLEHCCSIATCVVLVFQRLSLTPRRTGGNAALMCYIGFCVLFRQARVSYAPAFADEELGQNGPHGPLERVGIHPHPARNPGVVVGDTASRRHPAEAQQTVVCAIFLKGQVRGIGLEVLGVEIEERQAHSPRLAFSRAIPERIEL